MASIVSMGNSEEKTPHRRIHVSLDLHDKIFLLIAILIIAVTPYITSNFLNFNPEASTPNVNDAKIKERISLDIGESKSYQMIGLAQNDWLTGWATWGKSGRIDPSKDIHVVVKYPSGLEIVFDDPPSTKQTFIIGGPLDPGTYTLTLTNDGQTRLTNVEVQAALGRFGN
ncbi:MAG: hypothetical protein AAB521_00730 [Patescibacteria group bacterium]|mgnify:CR=1 FL=1